MPVLACTWSLGCLITFWRLLISRVGKNIHLCLSDKIVVPVESSAEQNKIKFKGNDMLASKD